MFTGIVRHVGAVTAATETSGGRRLTIDLGPLAEGLADGDSVAVSGVCLTASEVRGAAGGFDVVTETLDRTTLGSLRSGERVNLERSLAIGGALDGHIVQGHVDAVATVREIRRGDRWEATFAADAAVVAQMVPKGSIAVDGVSLTLAAVGGETFGVALIPTTLSETTLAALTTGDRVNVELDVLGKYVRKYLQQMLGDVAGAGGLTLEKLKQAGFV